MPEDLFDDLFIFNNKNEVKFLFFSVP
jgi:hypothetical protein